MKEHHLAKLTFEQVKEIRHKYDTSRITVRALAEAYGLSHAAVSHIVRRITWVGVEPAPKASSDE